jgi:hypothetical protein
MIRTYLGLAAKWLRLSERDEPSRPHD